MVKVLTQDYVADPTKVEAKVRQQMTDRASKHEEENNSRRLTGEQRKQKKIHKLIKDQAKGAGTNACVYW